jgi:glutamyl-tRNA synthetase
MHIGNLRTGLYTYLLARHLGGTFILRIEDTDQRRYVPEAIQVIYDSLRLAGLDYDEGPDKGGAYGPYVQSERLSLYKPYVDQLVTMGAAYPCFCARRDQYEEEAAIGPDPCRFLSLDEVKARLEAGDPHVIRQKIPQDGTTTFVDRVFGEITVRNDTLDDQVLLKSDGFPTYNFANVIDDHLMGITHVVRGVEYLSSAPKYNLLYQSFGWEIPQYVHLPHILGEDGKKLSKRNGDASFQDLLAQGYLAEAIVNYVVLLGWNPGDEREFFTLADLIEVFEVDRINKSSATFSRDKLDWFNGQHLRTLSPEQFHELALPYYPPEAVERFDTAAISRLLQSRVEPLTDIPVMVEFFLRVPEYSLDLYTHAKFGSTPESSRVILTGVESLLRDLDAWTNESLVTCLKSFAAERGLKVGAVMWPIRIALTGLAETPGNATEIAAILGQEETLRRISGAQARLDG